MSSAYSLLATLVDSCQGFRPAGFGELGEHQPESNSFCHSHSSSYTKSPLPVRFPSRLVATIPFLFAHRIHPFESLDQPSLCLVVPFISYPLATRAAPPFPDKHAAE